jgi:hypothetical protein
MTVSSLKHRAIFSGQLSANGEAQTLEMRYVAYGNVNVHVLRVATDNTTSDANRGRVLIGGVAPYAGQFPFGSWVNVNPATGVASFVQVGGGSISASYYDPVTGRTTNGNGVLTGEGSTLRSRFAFDTFLRSAAEFSSLQIQQNRGRNLRHHRVTDSCSRRDGPLPLRPRSLQQLHAHAR